MFVMYPIYPILSINLYPIKLLVISAKRPQSERRGWCLADWQALEQQLQKQLLDPEKAQSDRVAVYLGHIPSGHWT